jgi:uncharacterized protein YjbJ (UPF0337 family)
MSEPAIPNGEESIDETGRNLTQQEIDRDGASEAPVEGRAKEAEGKLTGDKGKEAEGEAQGGLGKAKDAAGDLGDAARDKLDE